LRPQALSSLLPTVASLPTLAARSRSFGERWRVLPHDFPPALACGPDEEYEAKIAGLIERSWKHDVAADANAATRYREAFRTLKQSDHYLLIMIERALRKHLRPWWAFW
jgi:hypothetical protein